MNAPSAIGLAPRILTVLIYTLLPLGGVLFAGWDWREVIILYWLENVALGVAMVIRLLRTTRDPGGEPMILNGRPVEQGPVAIVLLTLFFMVHYGLFTLVHGVFVFSIAAGAFSGIASGATSTSAPALGSLDWLGVLLVFAIGGIAQIVIAAVGPLPPQRGTALMMSAYPRIIVLHIAILGSAFLIAQFGWPAIAAIILIALHGIVDAVAIAIASRRTTAPSPG